MTATKSLSARTPERHGAVLQQNRIRLEELEHRMLLSRGVLSSEHFGTGDTAEPPPDESATPAIVARESTYTTSATPADSTTESDQASTQPESTAAESPSASALVADKSSEPRETGEPEPPTTTESPPPEVSTAPTYRTAESRTIESADKPTESPAPEVSSTARTYGTVETVTIESGGEPNETPPPEESSTAPTSRPVETRSVESADEPIETPSSEESSTAPTSRPVETRTVESADEPIETPPPEESSTAPTSRLVETRRVESESDTGDQSFTPANDTPIDRSEPPAETEPEPEPSPRTGPRRIEAADEPSPTDPPSDTADEPAPTPIRPVRQEPVRDVEKSDEPTTQPWVTTAETAPGKIETSTDPSTRPSETDRPETIDQSPSCIAQETDGASSTECQTKQFAITAQPSESSEEAQEAATIDRGNPETIAERATSPESSITESPQAVASPPRSESQSAEVSTDQWSEEGLPQNLLADALTDALEDEHTAVADSELGRTVFAAGAFAVVFSKPLSRLTGLDNSTFGDPTALSALPVAFTRKRRKDTRKSPPGTKDKPDDTDDPDETEHPSRGRGPARESTAAFERAEPSDAPQRYGSIEAAIHATLHSWRDSSDDSAHAGGIFHSAKSFAAGAIVAATALLTLQGSRRPERSRPELRPAAPTYHGQTAVAAS